MKYASIAECNSFLILKSALRGLNKQSADAALSDGQRNLSKDMIKRADGRRSQRRIVYAHILSGVCPSTCNTVFGSQ